MRAINSCARKGNINNSVTPAGSLTFFRIVPIGFLAAHHKKGTDLLVDPLLVVPSRPVRLFVQYIVQQHEEPPGEYLFRRLPDKAVFLCNSPAKI